MGKALVNKLGCPPQVCWLFCSPDIDMMALLSGISDAVETDKILGCTTDGEISCQGIDTGSAVLGGMISDRITFHIASVDFIRGRNEQAGLELAKRLPGQTVYVQLFSDGITGNGCALLRGMASVLGEDIPISGGTAGDNGQFRKTFQFAGTRVLTDSAVAVGFTGTPHIGTGIRSGWTPIGLPKKVTRASGNILYELNHEPALKVFERFLGKHAQKLPAIGVEYPLGLIGHWGDVGDENYHLLRATMSVNRDEGAIIFAGEIPEGAMVSLTCGDTASLLEAATTAAQLAKVELAPHEPEMIFCYSCMARKIVLGRRTSEEIQCIRNEIGNEVPIIGFYSYGEYCRVRCGGPSFLHNETITISVLGD